ncbi:hypothetical protein DXD79_29795 [Hungatella hathewayi]|uniref:Uncharacterized protein n=1 Tax=Hungatella hathewayi TaxID=154046 RepID=A0A374NY09_9FIRM|nr:hypothetical protein DXD79_29795 [Hungatella hathewayi]RGL95258.1 hypothetical protein DXC39_28040 [Hungatella hathewayi]RGO66597.1 hypothetical protein DXB08_27225 [Hungatella hathewayi]RHC43030.1 hypothetical protein DW841_31490 [Hungatella hathewayi]RHM71125.1 hypothetical protein DWZ48_27005 [Hungatella hathewayi]
MYIEISYILCYNFIRQFICWVTSISERRWFYIMSTYEEFMTIINAAMLIIAILVYIDRKNGTKK